MRTFIFDEPNKTTEFARKFATHLKQGDVIIMQGDLGSGKTFFAKGVGLGLNVNETVISPTFNIVRCYFNGTLPFYHIDAYRLEGCNQDIGLDEYLEGDGVCLVEWPEFIKDIIPSDYLEINIKILGNNSRKYDFIGHGKRYEELLEVLENE